MPSWLAANPWFFLANGHLCVVLHRSCHVLEGEIREVKTEELRRTLDKVRRHVESLIDAAKKRASAGQSPSPTARGGLGTMSPPEETRAVERHGSLENLMEYPDDVQDDSLTAPIRRGEVEPTRTESVPANITPATVGTPMRTRVLRRVSSIRNLFLGAAEGEGERLQCFADQMGLPHSIVVEHVRVSIVPRAFSDSRDNRRGSLVTLSRCIRPYVPLDWDVAQPTWSIINACEHCHAWKEGAERLFCDLLRYIRDASEITMLSLDSLGRVMPLLERPTRNQAPSGIGPFVRNHQVLLCPSNSTRAFYCSLKRETS